MDVGPACSIEAVNSWLGFLKKIANWTLLIFMLEFTYELISIGSELQLRVSSCFWFYAYRRPPIRTAGVAKQLYTRGPN